MKRQPLSFTAYRAALSDYISGNNESALARAYELGHCGFENGDGVLQILRIHDKAVHTILASAPDAVDMREMRNASAEFLVEALSPFEMVSRGYRDLLQTPQRKPAR